MTTLTIHQESQAPSIGPAIGRDLTEAELLSVSGGHASETYTGALTIAAGFVGVAAATVGIPVLAGAFALGSIGASAVAIYSALNDDEHNSQQ